MVSAIHIRENGANLLSDEHSISLVNQFHVAAPIASILASKSQEIAATSTSRPGETAQILFGLVSLLRHLAIPCSSKFLCWLERN